MLGALGGVTVVAMLLTFKHEWRLTPLFWTVYVAYAGVVSFA